jgi:formylglycine-generating enzyme required for sulfatase activity
MNRLVPVLLGVTPLVGWSWSASHAQCGGDGPKASERKNHDFVNSIGMKLCLIPGGEFQMGSPPDEPGRRDDEPQRRVRLTRSYFMGQHEVTRGQFRKFVEATGYKTGPETDHPAGYGYDAQTGKLDGPDRKYTWRFTGFPQTDDHPVVNVNWYDAAGFCEWLSRLEGRVYRLPTEAEWEYACRGGTTTSFFCGSDKQQLARYANIVDLLAKRKFPERVSIEAEDGHVFTAPVGSFKPNPFGLHDMAGNVWEWCADWYARPDGEPQTDPMGPKTATERVIKGGDWYHDWSFARSASRFPMPPNLPRRHAGFRVVAEEAAGRVASPPASGVSVNRRQSSRAA